VVKIAANRARRRPHHTATGYGALFKNTIGNDNTLDGAGALGNNTSGGNNTACGFDALVNNSTGSSNIAVGILPVKVLLPGVTISTLARQAPLASQLKFVSVSRGRRMALLSPVSPVWQLLGHKS